MSNQKSRTVTRRGFLKWGATAAGAAAVPYYVPETALGRGGAVAPSDRILVGNIGVGGRGSHDLGWMLSQGDIQFVAVCDVRKVRRDAAKHAVDAKYGNKDCAVYRDLRELLARPDIDAVVIATGDRWHSPASVLAMRAGKDVYCEKPACLTIAQGQTVVETARRYGRVYQTGAQRLSEPHHVFAIEMARTGKLGPIHTVYADCRWRGAYRTEWLPAQPEPPKEELDWDLWLGPCPWRPYNAGYANGNGWYNFEGLATDMAMWGAHTIAQALAGLDMTDVSTVELEFSEPTATMMTRLSNGVKLVLYRVAGNVWAKCEYWHGSCGERFDGPEGWAGAADGYSKPDVSSPAMLGQYKTVLADYEARTRRPMNHVRDFLDCVRSRRQPVANPEVMFRSMSICLAADICNLLKRNLKFDLRKAEFVGDAEANRMRSQAMRAPYVI
ncbi:MAG: Inositol 2-dehydrogenase [Planctomycetes bacterium ADurb.Bin126]|nr:MAG: Inositol 2-dehydrogenase [Planctomycetes bacterium ADurb.Bin126]HOD82792.1 Gfo/Idh/MocA family oxidoreductase [Phycisphaerae bacterium]HQL75235.1 Gfo/Idh/MocA family oxidoreductase [Phycisphaerae bacterium]